ncbi:MAG TPA: polysaccharide deacetylase family protein [Gemmatimonadales bacterium]|nr:polysaccharide deacetylase family protein [Gemmatimonadales bacterium]
MSGPLTRSLLRYSGAVSMWQRVANHRRPLIVYWHNVHGPDDDLRWCREPSLSIPVELFRQQIEYLRGHYDIVPLEEAATGRPGTIALTFDDGYRGVYQQAFPVLVAYALPATVFLVTDRIGSGQGLWWDDLVDRLRALRRLPATDREPALAGLPAPWPELLAAAPEGEVVDRYKQVDAPLRARLDACFGAAPVPLACHREPVFLSAPEIRVMASAGIAFGAHTCSHPLLPWLDDAALRAELEQSKERVEFLGGQGPCWFAYPDGNFGERERDAVRAAGFSGAVQTFRRPDLEGRYAVPRVGLDRAASADRDGRLAVGVLRYSLAAISRRRLRTLLSAAPATGR